MLKHLFIQNYALISRLDIDLQAGFSVMTGETGAGKSIILGALALVMGGKADAKTITEGEDKCVIEALFDDQGHELLIRRELNRSGRSRSFVNDEVVSQGELKDLSARLIDIHSQHENLLLRDNLFQLSIVDALAHNEPQQQQYSAAYEALLQTRHDLDELQAEAARSRKDKDYLQFLYTELDNAHLSADELEQLEQEHYKLSHAEEIKAQLNDAINYLDSEGGILYQLGKIDLHHVGDNDATQRLDSSRVELKDILHDLERLYERTEIDPARLQIVEERIDLLNTLLRKHSVQTVEELITLREQLNGQLQHIDNYDERIALLTRQLSEANQQAEQAAQALSRTRNQVLCPASAQLIERLSRLNVPHANIAIEMQPTDDFTPEGKDRVQLLFAANLNQSLRPVSEVASGGEISRLMLCVKAMIASSSGLPTIIFDEIDTGVSGETATQMAHIMADIAQSRQVIAITHLPQIAAAAATHYRVFKQDSTTRTETGIRLLCPEERIREIATILSGNCPTEAAMENAKQLLQR